MDARITEINFIPVKPRDGLIGFVSFVYNDEFYLGSIAVFSHLSPGKPTYRLSYPEDRVRKKSLFHPINRDIQQSIETKISAHLDALMPEGPALYETEQCP